MYNGENKTEFWCDVEDIISMSNGDAAFVIADKNSSAMYFLTDRALFLILPDETTETISDNFRLSYYFTW